MRRIIDPVFPRQLQLHRSDTVHLRTYAPACGSLALALIVLLSACQPAERREAVPGTAGGTPVDWPQADYEAAAREGSDVYRLTPGSSNIDIIAGREGPMARFGHDHVISLYDAEGFLAISEPLSNSLADIRFRVADLEVDEAGKRQQYRLDSKPDSNDIESTRHNMLYRVLEADQWPFIFISISDIANGQDGWSADVELRVKDHEYRDRLPFNLVMTAGAARVSGEMKLKQSELGLQAFSVLGGGLRVADELHIHFDLTGYPVK